MLSQTRMLKIYLKVAYTGITQDIIVDSSMTISQFMSLINNYKTEYFQIHKNYCVEIIESGNNINGDAELAPVLYSSEESLEEKYGNTQSSIAFYIRPINPETKQFIRGIDYSINPIQ